MWGNLRGWIIAGVLLALLTTGTFYVGKMNYVSTTSTWGQDPNKLSPLKLDPDPSTVVPMNQPGDAGALYESAMTDVRRNASLYEQFSATNDLSIGRELEGVKAVLEAGPLSLGPILSKRPSENIGYFDENASDNLKALQRAGEATALVGALLKSTGRADEAKRYFEAQFALGAKMFAERLVYQEALFGIGHMRSALRSLNDLYAAEKNADKAKKMSEFDAQLASMLKRIQPLDQAIRGVDEKDTARYAGDFYYFTTPAMQERMWRVEAILKLGRMKYNAGGQNARLANQAGVPDRLAELQKDPDPVIQAAATAAQNLTLAEFRNIR
ncbi:MAG TPA: hypothetical protein VGB55_14030 [Tepidisphaeraceae bacterium]|jgi:hypothetical protein